MLEELSDTFEAFAGGKGMDNRAFVKCLRDSGLIDQHFKTSDADLTFAQFRPKGGRHIDIIGFMRALVSVANRRRVTERDVVAMILASKGPHYQSAADAGLYPSSDDDREPLPRLLGHSPRSTSAEEKEQTPREEHVSPLVSQRGVDAPMGSQSSFDGRPVSARPVSARPEQSSSSSPMRMQRSGPERFFYDKTTYTGTWRHGGPIVDESPLHQRPFGPRAASMERRKSVGSGSVAGSARASARPKTAQLGSESSFDSRRQSVERGVRIHSARDLLSAEPSQEGPEGRRGSRGPERFYYDRSTFTGTWRNGGPTNIGSGISRANSPDVWAERWASRDSLGGSGPVTPQGGSVELSARGASAQERARTLYRPSTSLRAESRDSRSPSKRGPERFYYDKSTYTGTWKNGGPTTTGNGLDQKTGYSDLSQLVNRGHTQDDALHRRRTGSPMNSVMGSVAGSQVPSPRKMVHPADAFAEVALAGLEVADASAGLRGARTPQMGGSVASAASSRGGSVSVAAAPGGQWATPVHPGRAWQQWVQPPTWG